MNWDNLIKNKFINNFRPGIYCDVGACKGEYTTLFKQLCGTGKVFAFEINQKNLLDIEHLSSDKCIIENLAVSDKDGCKIDVYGQEYQSNILGYDVGFNKCDIVGSVESVTLDNYFKNIKVDFLKIDVEGSELKVILGGINTIKNSKLTIIECHFDEDWEEIYSVLKKNNLNFRNIIDDEFVFYGNTKQIPGRSFNGRPYQMYLMRVDE